jgi:cation/acetate symporter
MAAPRLDTGLGPEAQSSARGKNSAGSSAQSGDAAALINVANVLADARWVADVPASAANRLANRVGWFDLNNINCGLLSKPLGFLVMIVVSLVTSREMQALIDEIRKPRGRTVLKEKA